MKQKSELRELNGRKLLYVDGEPFLILGLQLNCDSCYDPATMDRLLKNARKMGCNSVALLLYWRLIEPEEGKYDFSILQAMLDSAKRHDLKIVLVWFGAYKNATMHYAPDWLIEDPKRFRRVQRADGTELRYQACFRCEQTLEKDRSAVAAVFAYLREHDRERSVILFQVNNETGVLGGTDRCYCAECREKYAAEDYETRYPGRAAEAFMAESNLRYQEAVAEAARREYDLPCYMNAWLAFPNPTSRAGYTYPGGGPVFRVLDIFCKQKKNIDFVSPDIYVTGYRDFHRICSDYSRENNPLYIAEHGLGRDSRAYKNVYYAIGTFAALGFDPWAIDCAFPDVMEPPLCDAVHERWNDEAYDILESYLPIRSAMIPVAENMGTDRLRTWVQEEGEKESFFEFDDACIQIGFSNNAQNSGSCNFQAGGTRAASRGMVIRLGDKKYLTLGCKSFVQFLDPEGHPAEILRSERGHFEGRSFVPEAQNTIAFETRRCCIWMKEASVCVTTLK